MQLEKIYKFSNVAFVIIIVVLYLVVAPILFIIEYKNNDDFKNLLVCEYKDQTNFKGCVFHRSMEKLVNKSNTLISFTILFWLGLIIEKDIWPNRKKIKKFLDSIE